MRWGLVAMVPAVLAAACPALGRDREPVRAALEWKRRPGSAQCIDEKGVADGVEARLERRVFVRREQADVVVEGSVGPGRTGSGWEATLRLRTTGGRSLGTRELRTHADHCSSFDESIALVIALMVDIPRERIRLRVPRETPAPRLPWRFESGLAGVVGVGLQPGLGLGLRGRVAVDPPRFWLSELTATAWAAGDEETARGGATVRRTTVGLAVCPVRLGTDRARVDVCGGQRVGRQRARGLGFDSNRDVSRLVLDATVRARGSLALASALELRLAVGVGVPIVRDRLVFRDVAGSMRAIFRPWPVAPEAAAEVGGRF